MTTSIESPVTHKPQDRWRKVLFVFALLATVVAAFYGIENWRGRRAWAAYQKEAAAQGFHTDWAYYVPKPVPDEENFAATPFLKAVGYRGRTDTNVWLAFDSATRGADGGGNWQAGLAWKLESFVRNPPMTPGVNAALSGNTPRDCLTLLAPARPQLDELRAASRRPYAQFEVSAQPSDNDLIPNFVAIRGIGRCLLTTASAHLQLGENDAAFTDLVTMQRLADALRGEPYLVSAMVRVAVLRSLLMQGFWEGWVRRQWSDQQLAEFQKRFADVNVVADVDRSLRAGEMVGTSQLVLANLNDLGRVIHLWNLVGPGGGSANSFGEWLGRQLTKAIPSGWVYQNLVTHNRFMMRMVAACDAEQATVSPSKLEDHGRDLQGLAQRRHPYTWLASIAIPNFVRAHLTDAHCQTAMQQAALACALERYRRAEGRYPGKLEDLMPRFAERLPKDVCTGEPMHYRVKDDGTFLLYSVGWNTTDDSGKVVMKGAASDQVDLEQGDWVWPTAITGEQ
jgi:hypothetical protein